MALKDTVYVELHFTMEDGSCVMYRRRVSDSPGVREAWNRILNCDEEGRPLDWKERVLGASCPGQHSV